MRTLSATLTQAQKDMGGGNAALCKAVLTSGTASYTYIGNETSSNILLRAQHNEQPYSQKAKLTVDNSDGALTSISFEGYTVTISYGYNTSAGDEYSATAPLRVKGQELYSTGGQLTCVLECYGIPDQLNDDHASAPFTPSSTDTQTVKTLINGIAGATLACYKQCSSVTVTYDSEDSLIDTFVPKDYFRIYTGETRLAKIKELLSYTKCVMRAEDDGALHVFNPTVSGVTYDYEYNDISSTANHAFFSKVYRNRLVLPNGITVKSPQGDANQYTGSATDATSYGLLPKDDYKVMRLASNAQAQAIANAIIQKLQVDHQKGNCFAPMNVGQEVHDYVKVTDAREGDNRVGNIGFLNRTFDLLGKGFPYGIGFGFGDVLLGGFIEPGATDASSTPDFARYSDLLELQSILQGQIETMYRFFLERDTVPKWHVVNEMIIPVL